MINKLIALAGLAVLMLSLGACAPVPFERHERTSMKGLDPLEVAAAFSAVLPERLNLLSSLVFRYTFIYKVSALGTIEADTNTREFSVVGMSPMGVKLFAVNASDSGIESRYVIPPVAGRGDLAGVVARDIRRIYFDLAPSPEARVRQWGHSIEYMEPFGQGTLVFVFEGPGRHLVSKKYYETGRMRWKVEYYEYRMERGRLYPGGIVLTNREQGYSLTAVTRKIFD